MSLGEGSGDAADRSQAELRALAHPVRLRILSLLTGASLTAAEVARELGLTHANASYHLRNLLAGGIIVPAGEERIRGGVAKRYRYDVQQYVARESSAFRGDEEGAAYRPVADRAPVLSAVAGELRRRATRVRWARGKVLADAELWVDPAVWRDVRDRIARAARDLHDAAQAPRTPGTLRTSTTIALFEMRPDGES
jgi:DNA-binding transcriptional ArsR family regulator